MSLPVLAPALHSPISSANSGTQPCPQSAMTHTRAEWEAMYPEIERLYVRERWKLQAIMKFMESRYGFKATPQMYKKRFAKWGFQKNKKRWATADPALSVLNLSCDQSDVKFMFLDSVRSWSLSFYEEPHKHLIPLSPTVKANEISFAFKMIVGLLDRGRGELAGRLARKAFLLAEGLLTLDGPALLWNLLDLMHHMLISHAHGTNPALPHHTTQLFHMLIVHLDALVANKFKVHEKHPLTTILRLLRRLTGASSASVNRTHSTTNPLKLNPEVAPLLEQAWNLNAKLMFENFSAKLLHVYWYLSWDSCSINLPSHVNAVILKPLKEYGKQIAPFTARAQGQQIRGGTAAQRAVGEGGGHHVMGERGQAGATRASRPVDTTTSVAAPEQTALLGTLAGLLATKVLDELQWEHAHCDGCSHGPEDETPPPSNDEVSQTDHASNPSPVYSLHGHDNQRTSSTRSRVNHLRYLLSHKKQASGRANLQVVREMWALEDELLAAGQTSEVKETNREWQQRLEAYLGDIPATEA
ncbi:hypothetical protein V8F20_011625 [Naviculisporaceae sp. PSN 640]